METLVEEKNLVNEIRRSPQDENFTKVILTVLNTQPGTTLAVLFGSLAAGRERADSDLDLAVDAGRHPRQADPRLSAAPAV